jgi:general secretion pathway protein D
MVIRSAFEIVVRMLPLSLVFLLCTCTEASLEQTAEKLARDPIDWKANLTRDEIREALRPERKRAETKTALEEDNPIPPLASVVLAPDAPEINSTKKVSLSITEDVDLKDVLVELARLAELELALDPNISGGIILSVRNRNVGDVLEMVADMAELKYSIDNGVLRVVRDHAYLAHYNVDYLNLTRSSTGSVDTQTSTGGGGSGGGSSSGGSSGGSSDSSGGSKINSGSTNTISLEQDGDLWASVEKNIDAIVKSSVVSLKKASVASDSKESEEDSGFDFSFSSGSDASRSGDTTSSYSINKQAGIISVFTTYRKHKSVQSYLDRVMTNASSQVLIEAKVIEVELNEAYSTGINWTQISGNNFSFGPNYANNMPGVFSDGGLFAGTLAQTDSRLKFFKPNKGHLSELTGFLDFLQGFGITRTLSNPRVTIMNNQQAVLTFAKNQPYFNIQANTDTTTSAGGTTTSQTFDTELKTVPIGVILALQPSINVDTNEVTLHIRPTLTTQTGELNDPSIKLNQPTSTVENKIPIVQVREMDTVLKSKSGDVMVIGGLIQHVDQSADKGVPFLQEIPILGNLAKQTGKNTKVTETVILLKAVIVPPRSNYHPQDKKIYETFTQDPRPLVF